MLREHARQIWQAAVDAADPRTVIMDFLAKPQNPIQAVLAKAPRIIVVGAGKAGAAMVAGLYRALDRATLGKVTGIVNVPDPDCAFPVDCPLPAPPVILHGARPAGSNHPTQRGIDGAERMLQFLSESGPDDVGICLLSGGGSALLPAPAQSIALEDKQQVTKLLHASGATINEMNAVRKHLSRIKGGRLAQAFRGRALYSLVVSDVIDDPLDVIASGPTAPDPTTFNVALAVLEKYGLSNAVPATILEHLQRGIRGELPETLKTPAANVEHHILANNVRSLRAAEQTAEQLGYRVLNLGSYLEGETQPVAIALAGIARSIANDGIPLAPPLCLLSGGETTVTLPREHGLGGRNQEFALAAGLHLHASSLSKEWVVLAAGTDGEDGPTDAAGAFADCTTFASGPDAQSYLRRHDAYRFFEQTGDLLLTGLTHTNVMDVRVILLA